MQMVWETRTDCFAGCAAEDCVLSFAATLCRGQRSRLYRLHDVSVHPKEESDEHRVVRQLKKALYGTRRAALLFQKPDTGHGEDRVRSGARGSKDVQQRNMAGAGNCAR